MDTLHKQEIAVKESERKELDEQIESLRRAILKKSEESTTLQHQVLANNQL